MKVVRSWLSGSKGHWWYPFMASKTVKNLALVAAMSATAWAGVDVWYCSRRTYRLRCKRSTHIRAVNRNWITGKLTGFLQNSS